MEVEEKEPQCSRWNWQKWKKNTLLQEFEIRKNHLNNFESLQDFKTIKPRFSQIRRGFLCSKPRFSEKLIFYFWVTGPQKVVPLDFNHPDCISILVPILPSNLGVFLDIFIYFGDGLWPFWGAAWLCRFDSLSGENRRGISCDGLSLMPQVAEACCTSKPPEPSALKWARSLRSMAGTRWEL